MRISDWSSDVCSSDLADSFAATIEVTQLARAQSAYSGIVADRTAAIGQGTMTLSIGGTDYAIAIDAANDSLDGLAAAINTSDRGRAEERRVGKECVSTGRFGWWPTH